MSHSPLRNEYMVFETTMGGHFPLPLTLEAALDVCPRADPSFDSPNYELRCRRSGRSLPAAPPSTRKNSFEYSDGHTLEKARGESFSSNGSAPGMEEDQSGLSESDTSPSTQFDPYQDSICRLWDTYLSLLSRGNTSAAATFRDAYLPDQPDDLQSTSPLLGSHTLDDSHLPPILLGPSSDGSHLPPKLMKAPEPLFPWRLSGLQESTVSRTAEDFQAISHSYIPVPIRKQSNLTIPPPSTRNSCRVQQPGRPCSKIRSPISISHRPNAQRRAHQTTKPIKSPPPVPLKREEYSIQAEPQQRAKSQPPMHPIPRPQPPTHLDLPHRACPATNPYNSSHPYSINKTPPLPPLPTPEKSVFDYDTDDEDDGNRRVEKASYSSSSITSRLHIRGFSLGSRIGALAPQREKEKEKEGTRRRRSASEIVRGVFGRSRK